MNLSTELKQSIDNHIDAVKACLTGFSATEQREILQSIEAHIYESLEARSEGEPSIDLLHAVIAEMDPPESYGEHAQSVPTKQSRWPQFMALAALLIIALTILGIKIGSANTNDLVGHWESVDFVSSPDQFNPSTKLWKGTLDLKELTFLPDGRTDRSFWSWKKRTLHHSGDNTDAKLIVKKVNGEKYLFLEWVAGDVTLRGCSPSYYVLKSTSPATTLSDASDHARPPLVYSTFPAQGEMNVSPNTTEIRVVFDKDMQTDRMWSWCTESPDTFPDLKKDSVRFIDKRTCVATVKLSPEKTYVIWFNTDKFTSFRDKYNNPAVPYRLEFKTADK